MIDYTWDRCKNLQRINTIEIFYNVTARNTFFIEYKFHKVDFIIWKNILWFYRENIESILYNEKNIIIEEPQDAIDIYNYYRLESKNFNLYRNINTIPILEYEKWNNINKQMMQNTWSGSKLID